jgi:hypothetical protein
MKACEIKVGKTYVNRGAGKTRRTVLEIVESTDRAEYIGQWIPDVRVGGPFVRFEHSRFGTLQTASLTLDSFAKWAGREAE